MTRKDYIAIAEAINRANDEYYQGYNAGAIYDKLDLVADCIADTLAQDNPRFDRDRFLKACGI